jgi:hypothetical protein
VVLFEKLDRCDRLARTKSLYDDRGTHVGHQLSDRVCDSSFARFDVTRMLESTNKPRSGCEQYSCLVAVRDDERTERRQPDRKGSEDGGQLQSRRFGCHET